ncbi:hypothetical protein R3P38DRAFT_3282476 [Favolaschia claudopus]|uniref:Uncharacterized protein n=1 Tax=Favolaschia claudopus TaxID=2862362 RepID=A0AAW0ABZ9_9AGAR
MSLSSTNETHVIHPPPPSPTPTHALKPHPRPPRLRQYHAEELTPQTPPLHPSTKVTVYSFLVRRNIPPPYFMPRFKSPTYVPSVYRFLFTLFPFRFWVFCSGFLYVQYLIVVVPRFSHPSHLPYIRNLHRLLPQKIRSLGFLVSSFSSDWTRHSSSLLLACDCNCARCYPFPTTVYT